MDSVLKNMIRVGQVSSINPEKGTARVYFEAQDLVSYDLQVLVSQTLKNKDYYMPDIGEKVVCLFLPTGNAEGFILGAIYSGDVLPPVTDPDKRHVRFSDGTSIEYDRSAHKLNINVVGDIDITLTGELNVYTPKTIYMWGREDVTIREGEIE